MWLTWRGRSRQNRRLIELDQDPYVAVKEADVVYADVWISMGREREQARRLRVLAPYQVNGAPVAAKPDAIVMHCLPAHRGGNHRRGPRRSQSVMIDQAENRLHMQKAILTNLLGKGDKGDDESRDQENCAGLFREASIPRSF